MIYLLYFLVFINLLASLLTVYDKFAAKSNFYRIPERMLFGVSIVGGALFMYITMRAIRHKTFHKSFMIGLPLIIVMQILLLLLVVKEVAV